jgi:7-cyano-7-deazaguanine reductase
MQKAIDTVLGKNTTEYRETYAPDYLVAIDRQENRTGLGIQAADLPFVGFDVWHDYEASFLFNGYPVNGILKLVIPASSPCTVESKSLKLYLFSFIMQEMKAPSEKEAVQSYEATIRADLSKLVGGPVKVCFNKTRLQTSRSMLDAPLAHMRTDVTCTYLDSAIDKTSLGAADYQESPKLLKVATATGELRAYSNGALLVASDALKSNCKVTHQPDWGQIYIYVEGGKAIQLESLYKYIVSFRGENHFHEEIVECVFERLLSRYKPAVLDVMAFYTRRGGIDICPMRSTRDNNIFENFSAAELVNYRAVRS